MKVLVLKRDKIGDMLLTTPMLRHLKQSLADVEVHLLANDYNAWVIAGNPDIDRLWVYPRTRSGKKIHPLAVVKQLWQEIKLRAERFDAVIVAGGEESPRAIRRALRVRGKRGIAYCTTPALKSRLTDPLEFVPGTHEMQRMLKLLAPLGIPPPANPGFPRFILPTEWDAYAKEWLAGRGIHPQKYVVLGLGARRARKQPATAQVLRWAEIFKHRHGLDMVFMWTPGGSGNPLYPGDDDVARPVLERGSPYIHPFRGPVLPAIGLIWNAKTSLFPDSGLMHFAAASPGGVLGFFAGTDVSPPPSQWGPVGEKALFLEAETDVEGLSDEEVFNKLLPNLS